MNLWLDRQRALDRLKIRPQTLYAYVSRHQIAVRPDPVDARKSLYLASDIEVLAERQTRSRRPSEVAASAIDWGEPMMSSAITTIHRGQLFYRGLNVQDLARDEPFEAVARWLWQSHVVDARPFDLGARPVGRSPADLVDCLARLIRCSPDGKGMRSSPPGPNEAESLFSQVVDEFVPGAAHETLDIRLARQWKRPQAADQIRRALILSADHELNPSTFAARLAASTGASLPEAVMAGLCTLRGPRHGGATRSMALLVRLAGRHGPRAALQIWQERPWAGPLPGFGHRLYPDGDFRARVLSDAGRSSPLMRELRRLGESLTGQMANFDFELAAMCDSQGLESRRGLEIFTIGRLAGWLAHILEQAHTGHLIRPRARYAGPEPASSHLPLTAEILLGGRLD